jgi:hypothetical protein
VSKTSRSNGAGTEYLKKLERLDFQTFLRLVPHARTQPCSGGSVKLRPLPRRALFNR